MSLYRGFHQMEQAHLLFSMPLLIIQQDLPFDDKILNNPIVVISDTYMATQDS